MFPISRRFAPVILIAMTMTGCASLIGSLADPNTPSPYGPLVNQSIPGNSLHVYQLPRPTSNIGGTTSQSIQAENAQIAKVSNIFETIGLAVSLLSLGHASGAPLFLFCTASLTGEQSAEWWKKTSMEPLSLLAGTADKKYCFTENGRINAR